MKKHFIKTPILMLFSMFVLLTSCESIELDLLDNPNSLPPEQINVTAGINKLQIDLNSVFTSIENFSGSAIRTSYMFGTTYENAFGPGTAQTAWITAYSNILEDSKPILEQAQLFDADYEIGITHTIRAFALMNLVDFWGDVPYEEANLGIDNFNPSLTSGDIVYNAALEELDVAINSFNRVIDPDISVGQLPSGEIPINFFFDGDVGNPVIKAENWLKFATTLKFKMYLNLGDTDKLNQLIASGNLIDENSENVAFRYSTVTNPESRHPLYASQYGNRVSVYMSNSLMAGMLEGDPNDTTFPREGNSVYGVTDPRVFYYFYRQTLEYPTNTSIPSLTDALPCADDTSPYPAHVAFCATEGGYWGRDHGDADGIPPDNTTRTTFGVYPVGGSLDVGDGGSVDEGDGLEGAGITPILMSWQVDFLRAEASLTYGTGEDAKSLLMSGLNKSLDYVINFDSPENDDPDVSSYVSSVSDYYDNSTDKLEVVMQQLWFSSFLSSVESYNAYRRNGRLYSFLQPPLQLNASGDFPRSLFYVPNTANLNLSIDQKPNLNQSVFWADSSIPLN